MGIRGRLGAGPQHVLEPALPPAAVAARPDAVDVDHRSANLDVLRALAALYVLAGHAYLLSGSAIGFHDRNPARLLINTGGSGVWLFFALSGYLISGPFVARLLDGAAPPDLPSYARRRSLRIFPAYWVALAAIVAFGRVPGVDLTVRQLLVHGVLLHNLVPGEEQAVFFGSWTLSLEVLFYAAVPVVALALRRVWARPLSATAVSVGVLGVWLASIVFVAAVPLVSDGSTTLWLRILFPSMLSMFCPGILVAVAVHAGRSGQPLAWFAAVARHRRAALGVAAALAVLGALGATVHPLWLYDLSRQAFAVASGLALVLALTRSPLGPGGRLLGWLGTISYGVYLWQGVVIYVIENHDDAIPLRHTGPVAYVVHVAFLLALTIPAAWLSWHLIERPAMRLGQRKGLSVRPAVG